MAQYDEIVKEIKSGLFRPVYLLYGAEPYFIDSIANMIEATALPEEHKTWDQVVTYGREVNLETMIHAVSQYPMVAERRVVILKEAQGIEVRDSRPTGEKIETLSKYFQEGIYQPQTIFVICYKKDKCSVKLTRAVDAIGGVSFESSPIKNEQLNVWIQQYMVSQGLKPEQKAIEMLAEFVGTNLSNMASAVEKLKVDSLSRGTQNVTAEMVENNIGISKDYNNFELKDALLRRDVSKLNRIVKAFSRNEKAHEVIPIISLLFSVFQKLVIYYKADPRMRSDDRTMAMLTGENSAYVYSRNTKVAKDYYTGMQTFKILGILHKYDMRCKGVDYPALPSSVMLQEMLFQIMNC